MNSIDAYSHNLVERLFAYAIVHGEKDGGEFTMPNDDVATRNESWERRKLSIGDHAVVVMQKTKSGSAKGDDFKTYRVVNRDLEYMNMAHGTKIIARHMVAEGNWYPNPFIKETSESSMCLSRQTGPAWVVEDGEDISDLIALDKLLEPQYQKKPA